MSRKPPPKKKSFPFFLLLVCIACAWFVLRSAAPVLPKLSEPPHLYVQPSRQDLRLTLLSAIHKAHHSVNLVMFGLSDPTLLNTLQKKEKENIPLTIYYDPTGSPSIRKLFQKGVAHPIHHSGIMHQKILVVDEGLVFVGSANFTPQSLRMHDNLVVGLVCPKVARFLLDHPPFTPGYLRTLVGGQDLEFWLLPDTKGHALADLKKHLRTAQKTLRVALFTLTHPALVDELIYAHKRGVKVTVLVDLHSSLGASAKAVEALRKAQIPVLCNKGVGLLHHKFAWIDEHTLICGSANWTKAAFTKNSDLILILHNLTKEQKGELSQLWKRIEAMAAPPQAT